MLKRLDILHEDQNKIWQEIKSLREDQENHGRVKTSFGRTIFIYGKR
ncbi:MAG: hypothetical protein LZ171_05240 [Thaumarchaeota archaeon]|jgi:hypothetical protein|nr:hypothetical protein [Candidatus Geocrenenecus arthurdayi]MCL7391428.1 hypothetical protein [Candidatus Geocrenenecus arthurdayi]MCL7397112.1 hypothetical protein [Candidatus Geocrenenecus arthurdayi]